MSTHPGDPYTLQQLGKRRQIEAMRLAERQRLTASKATTTKLRGSAAAGLRSLADRLAPHPSSEAPAVGGC